TTDSDGADSARAMALAGQAEGLRYIAITDHSKSVQVTGGLDERGLLRQLDWVIGSIHLHTNLSEADMTRRVLRAMESGVVDCIGHPTGRRPGRRDAYAIDLDRIFRAARDLGVVLEVNG